MNLDWTLDAACSPHECWTSNSEPTFALKTWMGQICSDCPVKRECAAYAVDSAAQGGFYAGTWIPSREYRSTWEIAHRALKKKAGVI